MRWVTLSKTSKPWYTIVQISPWMEISFKFLCCLQYVDGCQKQNIFYSVWTLVNQIWSTENMYFVGDWWFRILGVPHRYWGKLLDFKTPVPNGHPSDSSKPYLALKELTKLRFNRQTSFDKINLLPWLSLVKVVAHNGVFFWLCSGNCMWSLDWKRRTVRLSVCIPCPLIALWQWQCLVMEQPTL